MKKWFHVIASLASVLAVGCTGPDTPPDAPGKPTVTVHGESLTVSWSPVAGAQSYTLYFTRDGTEPTVTSPNPVTGIAPTFYDHRSLSPLKDYRYALEAVAANGQRSGLSAATDAARPDAIITLRVTFANDIGGAVGALLLDVPVDPVLRVLTGEGSIVTTLTGTNTTGTVAFPLEVDHATYWGYTVFKDVDASGTLTTGDTVWGTGGAGTYSYTYYLDLQTSSFTATEDFDGYPMGTHTY